MDASIIVLVETDIAAQRQTIDRVFEMLLQRAQDFSPEKIEKMESIAYQLHNFYGGIEELLKVIATHCENNIAATSQWHSLLLKRMSQAVHGVRPAVLSMESYDHLNGLRAFRHFFRHAYGVPLDFLQLQSNLERAIQLKPLLDQDIDRFISLLGTNGM
jgi:hypothetical protein